MYICRSIIEISLKYGSYQLIDIKGDNKIYNVIVMVKEDVAKEIAFESHIQ